MNRLAILASSLLVLAGCNKKDDPAKPAEAKPTAPAAAEKPATGLNAPGNDPKIVELAKKALGCKWEGKDDAPFAAFDDKCPEYKAWREEKDAFANKKGEPTLVAFIEDSDDKVRYLGEKRLGDDLGLLTDQKLAARVLTVAEKTKQRRDYLLGVIIGNIVLEDATLWPRIKTLFEASKDSILRQAIVTDLLPSNPNNQEIFDWTRALMKDTSDSLSRTALMAVVKMKTEKPAKCETLLEHIESPDADFAGSVVANMVVPSVRCEAHYDAVLKSVDGRIKAKKANPGFVGGLRNLCDAKGKATPAQVSTAAALAHMVAEDKTVEASLRANAIDASFRCDPKGGKAYIGKFAGEKDQDIKDTVARLQKLK
jgi:hypothetical protein